jgi:hypothetical protein
MVKTEDDIDFLAEVIVSHLVTNKKISQSDIYVHLLGVFKRFFSKEVEKVDFHKNDAGEKEWNIFVHREGLYDLLPEGFFHSGTHKYFKDSKETIEEFRRHREEEKNARQFFMPVEQEFFKHLVNKEIFEQNFFYAPETIQEFIDFFNLNYLELNIYQKASLFFLLPNIPKISGKIGLIETCFRIILQEDVRIHAVDSPKVLNYQNSFPDLSLSTLGANTILGNICIDHNPVLLIEIGPLNDSSTLLSFLYGANKSVILRLIELFIQADLATSIHVLLNKNDESFIMGEKNYESRLNYSTSL